METASLDVSNCIATFRRPDGLARLLGVQAGHLWSLFGRSFEEYGPAST